MHYITPEGPLNAPCDYPVAVLYFSGKIDILGNMEIGTAGDNGTELITRDEKKIEEPREYAVVLLNDDYTTRDFVVDILMIIFHKNPVEAKAIMLNVHNRGRGVVGNYTWDIAQTKVNQVHSIAKQYDFPLKCVVEEA
jgi:ATP-dependent Clp protease adaptor protein ClpS